MHPGVDSRRNPSFSQRRNRRRYQRAILETLEQRVLLTAAFSNTDMSGFWSFNALGATGQIQFDNANNIVGGTLSDDVGNTIIPAGNYTISAAGAVTILANGLTYTGAMNASHDTLAITQQSSTISQLTNVQTILTRDDGTGFTNANVSGTWNVFLTGDVPQSTGAGTVIFDGNGHITGGQVAESGHNATITGGTYTTSDNGAILATIITNATAGGTLSLAGQLNNSKDIITQNSADLITAASNNDVRLAFLIHSSGTYAASDLNGSWTVIGDGFSGNILFDGNGHITGGTGFDTSDNSFALSGTYSIVAGGTAAGAVTLHITNLPTADGSGSSFTVNGVLNAGKNTLAVIDSPFNDTTSGLTSADSLVLLVNSSNHTPTLSPATFQTAFAGNPFTFTYGDLLSHSNAVDLDNQPITFEVTVVTSGTLLLNGSAVHTFPTAVVAGDNLSWTPAIGAKGTVNAFSIEATDGLATTSAVAVNFATLLAPTITLTATKKAASEINGTGSGMGLFTLARSGGLLTAPLEVTITIGGTATNGVDYTTISTEVNFTANQTKATIPISVIHDNFAEGSETVILTVVGSDTGAAYNPGKTHAGTVTIADAASTVSVAATKTKASEINGSTSGMGLFTFTRKGGDLSGAQTVDFVVNGTAAAGTNFNIPTSGILTFDTTSGAGTIVFAAGQKTATVPFFVVNDGLADAPALNVGVTIAPDNDTASYFIGTPSHAVISIADAAPTFAVTSAKAAPLTNGSVSRLGQFIVARNGLDLSTTVVVDFSLSGSAVDQSNFTVGNLTGLTMTSASTGTMTFLPGQKTATLTVNPTTDFSANSTNDGMIFTLAADSGPHYFVSPVFPAAAGDRTSTFAATVTKPHASEINGSTSGMGQFTVTRKGGDLTKPVTVDFVLGGTNSGFGVANINYHVITSSAVTFDTSSGMGTITFLAKQTKINLPFNSINDLTIDTPESQGGPDVHLVVNQDAAHTFLVNPPQTTADIIIADAASSVGAFVTKQASEINGTSSGMGIFTFVRTGGDLKIPLTVKFNLGGTAIEGTDFATVATHTVTFAAGKTTATVDIQPIDDVAVEGTETIQLVLQPDLTFSYFLDIANSTPTMNIADDTRPVIFGPVTNITGAVHGTPLNITFAALQTATHALVPVGGTLTFKVTKVLKGTLKKSGITVVPNTTTLATGESLDYTAAAAGTIKAFDVVAMNGTNASATIVVTIQAT